MKSLRREVNDLEDRAIARLGCAEVQRDSWIPREGNKTSICRMLMSGDPRDA